MPAAFVDRALAGDTARQLRGDYCQRARSARSTMKALKKLRQRITHEGRLTWLTVAAAAPAAIVALVLLWFGDYTAESPVDVDAPDRRLWSRIHPERARARRSSAANDDEPARGVARRRLFDSRPRRPRRRRAGRSVARNQCARRNAPFAAARRVRSDGAAPDDHGGNRRRGFHLRSRTAAAAGQPRRRGPARTTDGQIARPARARPGTRSLSATRTKTRR